MLDTRQKIARTIWKANLATETHWYRIIILLNIGMFHCNVIQHTPCPKRRSFPEILGLGGSTGFGAFTSSTASTSASAFCTSACSSVAFLARPAGSQTSYQGKFSEGRLMPTGHPHQFCEVL